MITLNQMYQYQKKQKPTEPLLSSYDAEWWEEYVANHVLYDSQFAHMFKSFFYFNQSDCEDEPTADVTADFIDAVKIHLMMNAEKYRQLWRVLSVPDAQNELYENVNGTETTTVTFGKKTEYARAEKQDTHETSNDAYTDTTESNANAYSDVTSDEKGRTHGKTDHSVAPYDSNAASLESSDDTINDAYTDKSTLNAGARSGNTSANYGKTHGTVSDTYGAHTDTDTDSGTETTEYKRHGNIGVTTVSGMLRQHKEFWTSWEFYEYIFKAIAKDLLLVQ